MTAKPYVEDLVREAESAIGSRMIAYDIVGRALRRSATWVRRLVAGHEVGLSADTYLRIAQAYHAHCARLEAKAASRARLARHLVEKTDALDARRDRPGPGDPGPVESPVPPRPGEGAP